MNSHKGEAMEKSIADTVAALFKNDGQCFELDDGRWIENVMVEEFEATIDRSGDFIFDPVAYRFSDQSAIVICVDAWNIEGDAPYSWRD